MTDATSAAKAIRTRVDNYVEGNPLNTDAIYQQSAEVLARLSEAIEHLEAIRHEVADENTGWFEMLHGHALAALACLKGEA